MVERKKAEDLAILRLRRMGISEEGRGRGVSEIPVFQRGVATCPLNEAIVTSSNIKCKLFVYLSS